MLKINQQLQKINDTSLANVIFYKNGTDLDNLHFYNIVFAGNGIFVVLKNEFGIIYNKIENMKYVNSQLSDLADGYIYSLIPRPPLSLFVEILEMFKYMNNKIKSELCVNVYYNKRQKDFHLSIEDQFVNGATADYIYNENYEMSKDYIRYLQIHSHNSMTAIFSSKDDKDENFTAPCYYGVVGKISENSKFYNVETKFRIWSGLKFLEIDFGDVFELGTNETKLANATLEKLNSIIDFSQKQEKKKLSKHLPITNNLKDHDFWPRDLDEDLWEAFSIDNIVKDCQS